MSDREPTTAETDAIHDGLRVEIKDPLGEPSTCKVWINGALVFDGVDRSVLLRKPPGATNGD